MDNVEKNYKIAFISDLHFDNISENTDNGISFLEAEEKKAEFIACLKRYFNDYIVCIVGDCYSNYKEMLNFIEELEQNKIYGFFVLGNHDYWSNGQKTYMEIIQFLKKKQIIFYILGFYAQRDYFVYIQIKGAWADSLVEGRFLVGPQSRIMFRSHALVLQNKRLRNICIYFYYKEY